MRFSFPHSHAFPGGEVRVEDAEAAQGMCVVESATASRSSGNGIRTETTFTFPSRPIAPSEVRTSLPAAGGWSGTRLEPGRAEIRVTTPSAVFFPK